LPPVPATELNAPGVMFPALILVKSEVEAKDKVPLMVIFPEESIRKTSAPPFCNLKSELDALGEFPILEKIALSVPVKFFVLEATDNQSPAKTFSGKTKNTEKSRRKQNIFLNLKNLADIRCFYYNSN